MAPFWLVGWVKEAFLSRRENCNRQRNSRERGNCGENLLGPNFAVRRRSTLACALLFILDDQKAPHGVSTSFFDSAGLNHPRLQSPAPDIQVLLHA